MSISAFRKKCYFSIVFILFAASAIAQQQQYHYNVLHKSDNIGRMSITQSQTGDELNVRVVSTVQMHMLMTIKVNVAEESFYKKDRLMQSSIYREVNGKQKANRQTNYSGDCYKLITEGKIGKLNKTFIGCNLAKLYCNEPVNTGEVYSDNFQQFFALKIVSEHTYRLDLPNGNYNIYYYKNGICNKVDVHNTQPHCVYVAFVARALLSSKCFGNR